MPGSSLSFHRSHVLLPFLTISRDESLLGLPVFVSSGSFAESGYRDVRISAKNASAT